MTNYANINGTTTTITATSTTGSVDLENPNASFIEVYNAGAVPAFVETGLLDVSVAFPSSSAVFGRVIPPGAVVSYEKNGNHTHLAAITSSGSATLFITTARGI